MIGEPKRDLRLRVLDARRAMSDGQRAEQDRRLCDTACRWLDSLPDAGRRTLAGYAPIRNEPGGSELPAILAAHVGRLLLPVWQPDNDLEWAEYDGELLGRGGRPREPGGNRLGPHAIEDADVVFVPALAVDRQGMRLGRGGGSYDRALARLAPDSVVLALLYPGEMLSEPVPSDAHDQPVHGVIDTDGVHWLRSV
jgi:5-formyltetrahydrofolate cyclo-ligase